MFELISSILKYIFIVIIYLFIFGIIRLIYLDIRSMNAPGAAVGKGNPYLKLINRRESLNFKVAETYPLKGKMTVGRDNRNNIAVKDPYISGRHAAFELNGPICTLQDLGSTNGTVVNGSRLGHEKVILQDGDQVRLGQLGFLFVDPRKK